MARKLVSNLANVPLVTSLPTVTEATDIYYQSAAMATDGLRWHLAYNPASASAYKWEVIGGAPLFNEVLPDFNTASATYVTGGGPSLTLPLAGDYIIDTGFIGWSTAAAPWIILMSYDIGATVAADADALNQGGSASQANATQGNVMYRRRKNGLGAVALTAKYRVNTGTGHYSSRWMTATPVRVG